MTASQWQRITAVMLTAIGASLALVFSISSTSATWSTASQFAVVGVMTVAIATSARIAGLRSWDSFAHGPAAVLLLSPSLLYALPGALVPVLFPLWGVPDPLVVVWAACSIAAMPVATVIWGSPRAIVVSWVGLWLLTGGFAAYAAVDSLLHPSHALSNGPGIEGAGNGLATYLAILSWLAAAAATTAVLAIVLLARARISARPANEPAEPCWSSR